MALSIDLYFYTGYYGSDDKSYVLFANEIAKGNFPLETEELGEFITSDGQTVDFGVLRFAYTLPLSLMYFLSGGSLFAITFLNILLHIGILLLTFKLGELVDGVKVGLFAAFIVAVSPVFYLYSGMILPDNSEVFWLFLSIYMILKVRKSIAQGLNENSFKLIKTLFLSGLFLGLSYSAKLSALIMLVPLGIFLLTLPNKLFSKTTVKYVLTFAAGFAIVVIIETIIIYILFDDLIVRYQIIAGFKDHYLRRASQQGSTVLERYRRMWQIFGLHFSQYILYFALFTVLWFPFTVRKNNFLWFVLVWGILYKTFGTTNFSDYAPPVIQVRYFAFSVPLIGIITGMIFRRIYLIIRDISGYKNEVKLVMLVLIAGIFTAFAYLNVRGNLSYAGKLYRAPLIQSSDNAIEFLDENCPDAEVILSDTTKYWFYPYYFRDGSESSSSGLVDFPDSQLTSPYYVVGSLLTEFNEDWLNRIEAGNNSIQFIDVFHPDFSPYDRFFNSGALPIEYPNESIYDKYRSFVVKVDRGDEITENSFPGRDYLVLYHRTVYPDVRVFKNLNSHLITWDEYPDDRQIFINSFDARLKTSPPVNRLFGAVDSTANFYEFKYSFNNESDFEIEVKSEIYLYGKTFRINTSTLKTVLPVGTGKQVAIGINNVDTQARNYRIQLFILNKSGEGGKLSISDFKVSYKYNSGFNNVSR